jgi:hypothetical protein
MKNKIPVEVKRKMQAMGRQELASPVAEALRKLEAQEKEPKNCGNCEHYIAERIHLDESQDMNWCDLNQQTTNENDYCDEWKKC